MAKKTKIQVEQNLIDNIKIIIVNSRKNIVKKVNHTLTLTYWQIGKIIIENEKKNNIDSQSSRQFILSISKKLTQEVGRGFSRSNLFNMRRFYLEFQTVQTLSGQLSWSHICELLIIEKKEIFMKKKLSILIGRLEN